MRRTQPPHATSGRGTTLAGPGDGPRRQRGDRARAPMRTPPARTAILAAHLAPSPVSTFSGGHANGRSARAAESARLEIVCGATHRGFKSHLLRQRVFTKVRAPRLRNPCSGGPFGVPGLRRSSRWPGCRSLDVPGGPGSAGWHRLGANRRIHGVPKADSTADGQPWLARSRWRVPRAMGEQVLRCRDSTGTHRRCRDSRQNTPLCCHLDGSIPPILCHHRLP